MLSYFPEYERYTLRKHKDMQRIIAQFVQTLDEEIG